MGDSIHFILYDFQTKDTTTYTKKIFLNKFARSSICPRKQPNRKRTEKAKATKKVDGKALAARLSSLTQSFKCSNRTDCSNHSNAQQIAALKRTCSTRESRHFGNQTCLLTVTTVSQILKDLLTSSGDINQNQPTTLLPHYSIPQAEMRLTSNCRLFQTTEMQMRRRTRRQSLVLLWACLTNLVL